MAVSSGQQMTVFALSILVGACCGIFFDFQRSLRRIYGAGILHTTLQDILFVLVCVASAVSIGFVFNKGEIRYFELLGAAAGALIYSITISSCVIKFFCILHKLFIFIFIKPLHMLFKLIKKLLYKIKNLFAAIYKKIAKKQKKISSVFKRKKKNLKKRLKML